MTHPEPDTILLPSRLDREAAAALRSGLLERRGRDLRVDGADAGGIGAQCLQVLLSAQASWERDGRRFSITDASPELASSLALLGVGADSPLLRTELFR